MGALVGAGALVLITVLETVVVVMVEEIEEIEEIDVLALAVTMHRHALLTRLATSPVHA